MGFHYSDGSYVGGCGAQIGGLLNVAVILGLYGLGLGIGWSILIVIIIDILIMVLIDKTKD